MNLCKTCGTICPFDDERTECDAYAPMTNENWLRSCTTEQLAEWLVEHIDCVNCYCKKDLCCKDYDSCKLTFVEWLKQPRPNE